MWQRRVGWGAALVASLLVGTAANGQDGGEGTPKGAKKKEVKKVVVTEAKTNLDDVQKKSFKDAKLMIGKLFGYKDEVPEDGKDTFQKTIWTVINGTHKPDQTKSNKFATFLLGNLTKEKITTDYAIQLVEKTAEILGDPNDKLAQEDIDNYLTDVAGVLGSTQLTTEQQTAEKKDLQDLVSQATYNEEKVKQREADKERAAKAKEKEEQDKADRKAKQKSGSGKSGAGRTGGSGGRSGSGGSGGRSGGSGSRGGSGGRGGGS